MALALRSMDAGVGLSEQTVMENELEVRLEWHAVKRFMGRAGSPRERGVALNGGSRPNRRPVARAYEWPALLYGSSCVRPARPLHLADRNKPLFFR